MRLSKIIFLNFFKSGRKSAIIIPIILGFLFSASSRFIESNGQFAPYDSAFLINGCFYGFLFTVCFLMFEKGMLIVGQKRHNKTSEKCNDKQILEFIAPSWIGMRKYILATALFWIPTYLFLFPGIMVGDTAVQIEQFLSGNPIPDWHPFLETFIFGKFFTLGGEHNPMFGVGIFIACQMIVAIFVVSYISYYVAKITNKRYCGIATSILLAVYPIAPLNFMTMNKDMTFTIIFMLFCVLYTEVWRSRGKFLKKPSFLIAFIVVALLAMFTKKTGAYLIAGCLLLMVFMICKPKIKSLIAGTGIVLLLFAQVLVPLIVFPKINVTPGPKQEMLAIPEQQLARIVKDSPQEFNEQERQIIDDVIAVGFDGIAEKYDNYLVDPIKGTYVPKEESIPAFLKLWVKKGLEHPWQYIATEIGLESGWFSFTTTTYTANVYTSATDSAPANSLSEKITWPDASVASTVWASFYNCLSRIPILNLPMHVCVWASIVPFAIVFFIWRRAKHPLDALASQLPLLLSFGMLLLCPTSYHHARYMLPMMLTAPIFVASVSQIETKSMAAIPA